jgi:hypothetical protein
VRRAGTGRLPDGARVTWTIADGSRGRRWREVVIDETGIRHSLLFETGPDRRFSHLELATPAGLLTLHPEGDGTLHGNVVGREGVRHVAGLAWELDAVVSVSASAITNAAAAWLFAARGAAGAETITVLRIDRSLGLQASRVPIERVAERSWRMADGTQLAAAADGLPMLADGDSWPLEQGD